MQQRFDAMMATGVEVLAVTEAIARRAAAHRATLRRSGRTRTQADMLIAATADLHQRLLVTRNLRDFAGVGIRVLNPFS